jgi:RNA polymerase-binding transcription factor DksA
MRNTIQSKRVICHLCGQPISAGRLQALPGVTTCIECARKNPPRKLLARELDLSQSTPIDRTGFAPSD